MATYIIKFSSVATVTHLLAASFLSELASMAEVLANLVFHCLVVPYHVAWEVYRQGAEMALEVWVEDPHQGGLMGDLDHVEANKCKKIAIQ